MSTARKFSTAYTVENYRLWEGDWELIAGIAVSMSPSPFGPHERAVNGLSYSFRHQLKELDASCEVYAGLDWIVADDTVVRPDLMIVCGEQPEKHLERAPALVAEVLSPSMRQLDLTTKRDIYQQAGVEHYLIVDLEARTIEHVHFDNKEKPVPQVIGPGETLTLTVANQYQVTLAGDSVAG